MKKVEDMRKTVAILLTAFVLAQAVNIYAESEYKFSYYANGRICVDKVSEMNGKPIIVPPGRGHEDFKPSWSKTGNWLVFFRRIKNDPDVMNWKTQIHIVKTDGSQLQKLTDGRNTDFNPTWTRDGSNSLIFNRMNLGTRGFTVMMHKIGGKPGEEVALTKSSYHTWANTCLKDGRILVETTNPEIGWGYYLMEPKAEGKSTFQRINTGEIEKKGLMCRVSVSPDEKKVCFGHILGHKFKEPGHAMFVADFDAKKRTITNAKAIANEDYKAFWYAYPRWAKDGKAIIYHANPKGISQLFLYTLADGKTRKVSTKNNVDYRYPHGEATPK